MTVQTFIVNYNDTFTYLHRHFGKAAVVALWKQLSKEFSFTLRERVIKDGLIGAEAFFYGDEGITSRELVNAKHGATEDEYFEHILHCPSVNELVKRNKKRYPYYCEHCYWLYASAFAAGGFIYDIEYGLQSPDSIADNCRIRAYKAPHGILPGDEESPAVR